MKKNKALLVCLFVVLILAVLASQLPSVRQAAAQANWDIIVDNSINEGAVTGSVSNIQAGADSVTGDIIITNTTSLWWKVYIDNVIGEVDIDTSNPSFDENKQKYYFLLAPKGNSATDAIPTLPPSVTFHQPGSTVFFYADRTIESGFEALSLQVTDIALIALTGSGVPASVVDVALETLQAPPFVEAALALGESPPNVWKVVGALASITTDSTALTQLQYLLSHVGINMSTAQIADVFSFFRILQELVIIYDLFSSPFADNVAFQAVGAEDKPLIADIKCSPAWGGAPLFVNFDASDSYAPEYPIQSYEWDFGDGETGTGIALAHTYWLPGNYTVALTVTDTQSRQSTAESSITVSRPRTQVTGEAERFCLTFEAEDSPNVLSYSWDFGDGSTAEGRVVNNTYAPAGEYVVTLSLGLEIGDTTQDWVPWVAWDVIKVTVEADSSPAGWSFNIDKYDSAPETVALNGIIIEDADEVWTNSLESSAGLSEVAQNVTPRIVLEYGDSMFEFGLQGSVDLNQAAGAVSPRISVEYGDSIFELGVQSSENLNQIAGVVSARIMAEYADSIFELGLAASEDLSQVASAVMPRVMVEYADAIFSTNLKRPTFGDDTPPTVATVSPEDGATDVRVDTVITATFSESMDGCTITGNSFTLAGDNITVSGTVIYNTATYTTTFTSEANLDYEHEYTATLSTAITDEVGNPLAEVYTWSFTTPPGQVTVSINAPDRVPENYDFTVTVDIGEVVQLNGAQYDISFDPLVLRLDDVTDGQIDSTVMPVIGFTEMSLGIYRVLNSLDLDTVSGSGYLAVLHFHVIGSLGDSSAINLSSGTLSGWEAEIPATWIGDFVEVSVIPGDANDDGVVNVLDMTKVARIILLMDAEAPGADANVDGVVNVLDLTKIVRIILMLD